MGACNIDFEIKKKATEKEVGDRFEEQQGEDLVYYGQNPYSGSFATVETVEPHLHKGVFEDYNDAYDYCLDKAEKWHSVVAVHYKAGDEVRTLVAGWGAC